MTKSPKSTINLLLTFNKLLIFPLCITYIIVNFLTILNWLDIIFDTSKYNYFSPSLEVWRFLYNRGIDEYFYFFENIGMELSLSCNNVISVILTLMMIADIIFSIKNGRKQIIKWTLYGIIAVIVLFIGFVASPEFYDSV